MFQPAKSRPEPALDVLEAAAVHLLIQLVFGGRIGAGVLEEENVESAVAVEVEEGGAGPHDLRHEVGAVGRAGVVNEVEADAVGGVLEPAGIGRRRVHDGRRPGGPAAGRADQDRRQDCGAGEEAYGLGGCDGRGG